MENTKVVCLTPTKNEAWIIDKFLSAASLWADHIIVADQMSNDGTQEIVKRHKKAILIENRSTEFNESERQKLLIESARKIPGKKLLIALDADEFLSANFETAQEWEDIKGADTGTVFLFKWPFIKSTFKQYWAGSESKMAFAYMDDGANHIGKQIHSTRVPFPKNVKITKVNDIVIMHYQFTDWKRMKSKHRWYQCYERFNFPLKSAVKIFRMYNHMYQIKESDFSTIPNEWFANYLKEGIDVDRVNISEKYYWDYEVDKMLETDNENVLKNIDLQVKNTFLLKYLRLSRKHQYNLFIRVIDKLLSGIK